MLRNSYEGKMSHAFGLEKMLTCRRKALTFAVDRWRWLDPARGVQLGARGCSPGDLVSQVKNCRTNRNLAVTDY